MRTRKIVTAASSADLLKLVPVLAGIDPRESLVLVAFRGKRTAGALRLDLPAIADDDEDALPAWADRVVSTLLKLDGVDGVAPVVYTDALFADADDAPRRSLLDVVARVCLGAGLVLKDLLCVGGDAWAVIRDPVSPVEPRPLIDLVPDDASGLDDLRSTRSLTRVPDVDQAAQDAFADRVEAWLTGDGAPAEVHGHAVDTGFRRRDRVGPGITGLVDRALDGQDVAPFLEAAFAPHDAADEPCDCRALLAALLVAPVLRDVVLLQAAWGARFGRHVALHTIPVEPGADVDEAVLLAFTGGDFARPDAERTERVAAVLTELAGSLPAADRAPVLTAAAWLHWAVGRGSAAGALVDLALDADPVYGLAEILSVRLARGDLPEWAFRAEPGTRQGRRWLDGGTRPRG